MRNMIHLYKKRRTSMELIKKFLSKWIIHILTFVVGILSIIAGAELGGRSWDSINSSIASMHVISMVLGITLIVVASISLLASFVLMVLLRKSLLSSGIVSGILLSFGIWFVAYDTAGDLIILTVALIPFIMIVLGTLFLIDCIHELILSIRYKETAGNPMSIVISLILAVATIVIGILCYVTNGSGQTIIPRNVQIIILGVILCLESLFQFLGSFVAVPKFAVFKK